VISVVFCSRTTNNPDSALLRLLDSVVKTTTPAEREQVEFLIKFDSDDDQRPADEDLQKYPLRIRTFTWSRGEGRHGLHQAQEYLFAQHDPRSRFTLFTADDFFFIHPGWVTSILSVQDEFCILGQVRPPIEKFAGVYEQEKMIRKWVVSIPAGCWCPVASTRLLEVCQSFGWQANVDSWLLALMIITYDLYGVVLFRGHIGCYARGGSFVRPASMGQAPTYNNMEVTNNVGPLNRYWFELVRRQARNIYLNMECGSALNRRVWGHTPRHVWRRTRERPLWHLPARVCRKAYKTMCSFFA
jgi:hypothetical protein